MATKVGTVRRLGAGALAALLLAAACSGDDSSDDEDRASDDEEAVAEEPAADGSADDPGEPVPSAGCDSGATEERDLEESTFDLDGTERRYLLSTPAWEEGDDPLPLVVDIHGLAEGADVHAEMSQLGPLGIEEGFAAVFPHGTGEPVAWQASTDPDESDDLAYFTEVLDRLEEQFCLDTSRVYATGLSNGAMMTSVLACTMADRFAAVAPVAGIMVPEDCAPSRPLPVLTYHGTADPILLFNGGVDLSNVPGDAGGEEADGGEASDVTGDDATDEVDLEGAGYPAAVADWAALNGCEDSFEDEEMTDEIVRRRYDCPDDAPVEFVIILGGGHSWPGSEFSQNIEAIVGPTTTDVDASRDTWEFLSRFQLPAS